MNIVSINKTAIASTINSKTVQPLQQGTSAIKHSGSAIKKQLLGLGLYGMALLGISNLSSCNSDEPVMPDKFFQQCPKVDLPIEKVDGTVPKADLLLKGVGLIPKDASVTDVSKINIVDCQTNDEIIYTPISFDNNEIVMEYKVLSSKGDKDTYTYTYKIVESPNSVTATLFGEDGSTVQRKKYTQFSLNFDDMMESTYDGNGNKSCAIIRKNKNNGIKSIHEDNTISYYTVKTTLK